MLQILQPSDLSEELSRLYKTGMPPGTSMGWAGLDPYYTIAPGFWTVVTGIPSHGKSTWVDCLAINLMEAGWKVIIYSPENQPLELHLATMCEKVLRRPFRPNYHNRMEAADLAEAMDFLEDGLRLLRHDGGQIFPSLETFMVACDEVLKDWPEDKVLTVLDPWNEIDHHQIQGMTETQQINWELMRYRQWVRQHGSRMHGMIVAHPTKPQRDKEGNFKDVTIYDISGSSAWKNKCDGGIIIRRREDHTIVDVEKCRWRHLGKQGSSLLTFNSGTGNFNDYERRNVCRGSGDDDGDIDS